MKMKKLLILTFCVAMIISMFTGCGSSSAGESEKQIPDLIGEWKETTEGLEDSYQMAKISENTIEIYWISDNGDTSALYWAGSFTAPTTAEEPYVWESKNDFSKTENAFLASTSDTKTMTYENGIISYETSALGVQLS